MQPLRMGTLLRFANGVCKLEYANMEVVEVGRPGAGWARAHRL